MKKIDDILSIGMVSKNGLTTFPNLFFIPKVKPGRIAYLSTGLYLEDFKSIAHVSIDEDNGITYMNVDVYLDEETDIIYVGNDEEKFNTKIKLSEIEDYLK